jgi:hypothetical protein
MLALAQSLGFHRETADTPGLVQVVLTLAPDTARDGDRDAGDAAK